MRPSGRKSDVTSYRPAVSRILAESSLCIDADPVNHTLAQYKGLAAERLDLMREGSVDQRAFDGLMESLLTESGTFIV